MNAPERAQEVTEPRPESFDGIAVDLANSVVVVVAGPFACAGLVAHRAMHASVGGQGEVNAPLVGIDDGPRLGLCEHAGQKFRAAAGVEDIEVYGSGVPFDDSEDGGAVVFPGSVSPGLIGAPPGRIVGLQMRIPFFPPRSGTSRRLR